MTYDYDCARCGPRGPRNVRLIDRDALTCPTCGWPLQRLPHFTSVIIGIPAGFKTMFSDIHGIPGSPQREQFEQDVKKGAVVYAGPGARWV